MKKDEKKIIMIVGIFKEGKLGFKEGSQLSLFNYKAAEKEITFQVTINNVNEEKNMNGIYLN